MKFEKNFGGTDKKRPEHIQARIDKLIAEDVDISFTSGKKLYRDAINFWPFSVETIRPVPHYEQGYIQKGERDLLRIKEELGDEEANFFKILYSEKMKRILKLSDAEQIKKYNALVNKFNLDIERIKKENDVTTLREYVNRAVALLEEKIKK